MQGPYGSPVAPTLILTRTELRRCVDVPELLDELRVAFAAHSEDDRAHRMRGLPSPTVTSMVLAPGLAPGVPAYTVKVHAKNPDRRPAITGVICLHSLDTGDLLAVLDSGWLTSVRTGAGAAVGSHVLARPDAEAVGIIGAGQQGRAQLRALARLRRVTSVHVHDTDALAATAFAETLGAELDLAVRVRGSAAAVAADCDLMMVATWARTPVLEAGQVRPGTHVTSLGADEPGKAELDARLMDGALVVTDDRRLADAVLARTDTSLGAVLRGDHPGRRHEEEITVYSPLGLPMQDCLIAWHAYRRAVGASLGMGIDIES